jgi:uncharacterized protein (DUF2336 family)
MDAGQSLIAELEDAIQSGSKDKRVDSLRRITDLFLVDADRLTNKQIEVFDEVIGHLIKRIEGKALAELSGRLAPVRNAPIEVVRSLARHDDIAVAEPILTQSLRLGSKDLAEIASTKSQAHLLAISGRNHLDPLVTEILLDRGDRCVTHRLAANRGARFSERGFATLVRLSESDEQLAEKVGIRLDIPPNLFRQLLLRASEAVRSRLLALAGPESRDHIQRVLATISEELGREAYAHREQDEAQAQHLMLLLHSKGELSETTLLDCIRAKKHQEIVAALSLLCSAPFELIQDLLQREHHEAILIPCKAAGLEWPTVLMLLSKCRAVSDQDLDQARSDYFKLTQSSAQRVLRFWQVRRTTKPNDAAKSSNKLQTLST